MHCLCNGPGQSLITWEAYEGDCLNGTIYKSIVANVSGCEGACAADTSCAAIVITDGGDGHSCKLLKQPLVQWDNGRDKSGGMCRAAVKQVMMA